MKKRPLRNRLSFLDSPYEGTKEQIKYILEHNAQQRALAGAISAAGCSQPSYPTGTNYISLKNGLIKIGDYIYKFKI